MRLTFALCALLLSSCAGCRRASMPLEAALDDVIAHHLKPGEAGYAVLVARGPTTLLRRGYGLADVAARGPLTPEHAFQIGSITKQFTAAAILLLDQEKKLSLADELTRWVPFPTGGKRVTIAHLLASTCGAGTKGWTEARCWPTRRWRGGRAPPSRSSRRLSCGRWAGGRGSSRRA